MAQQNQAPNPNFLQQTREKLPEFKGPSDDAVGFLLKLDMLATKYQWPDSEKSFQLAFNLTGAASKWFTTLPQTVKGNWAQLRASFEGQFVNVEPLLVTEAKLSNRRLQAGESVDEYADDILLLGSRLGRAPQQLACTFLHGLPSDMQQFVIGTDTHTMDSYSNRAKLFQATQSSLHSAKPHTHQIAMAVSNPLSEVKDELINAVSDSFKQLHMHDKNNQYRHKSRDRYRDQSRDRYRERDNRQYRGRGHERGRNGRSYRSSSRSGSHSPRRTHRSKSPYRGRSHSRDDRDTRYSKRVTFQSKKRACYVCGSVAHWAKNCPDRFVQSN